MLGVARVARLELFAVEQFQSVENCRALLALHAAGDPPQGLLRGLVAVLPRDQNAEDRILRALVGKMGRQGRPSRRC